MMEVFLEIIAMIILGSDAVLLVSLALYGIVSMIKDMLDR